MTDAATTRAATTDMAVLRASVAHLRERVLRLAPDQLTVQAYPSEWTIADVLSHLGSAAVINRARLAAAQRGEVLADEFAPSVWDEWNAKSPSQQAADSLAADADLMAALEAVTPQQRDELRMPLGPITMTADLLVEFRVNEHAVHSWDIEVALDPSTTLPDDAVDLIVDRLGMIVSWTAKSDGRPRVVGLHTTSPERHFTLTIADEVVQLTPAVENGRHDVELTIPAEAFIRLVYGRLGPDHAPPQLAEDAEIDALRSVFRGV